MHRYNQIMKHIKVTPEIQDRIMEHIHQLDLNETKPKPATPFPFGKCLLIGACFVILVLGGFFAFNKRDSLSELYQQVVSHSIEYRSVKELSRAVGFNVRQVQKLPFEAEKIRFSSYRKKTAQIDYTGKDQAVSFRMSAGKKDVSGDHNQYTSVKDIPLRGYECDHQRRSGSVCSGGLASQRIFLLHKTDQWDFPGSDDGNRTEYSLMEKKYRRGRLSVPFCNNFISRNASIIIGCLPDIRNSRSHSRSRTLRFSFFGFHVQQ